MPTHPEFSIIVPVWNKGHFLRNALQSLRELKYPSEQFEVLVPGLSDDNASRQIIQDAARKSTFSVSFVESSNAKRATLLNAACRKAQGRILAFIDDDCMVPGTWLKTLHAVFQKEPGLGIVGGRDVFEFQDNTPFNLALDHVLRCFIGPGGARRGSGIHSGSYYPKLWNMAVPRETAIAAALQRKSEPSQIFDESLEVYQDVDLAKRLKSAGKTIVFAPELEVRHYRATTFRRFIKREVERARISRMMGVHRLPHLALTTATCVMLVLFLASVFSAIGARFFWGLSAIYFALLLITGFNGFLRTKRVAVLAIIPVLIVVLHVGRGIAYLFPLHKKDALQ